MYLERVLAFSKAPARTNYKIGVDWIALEELDWIIPWMDTRGISTVPMDKRNRCTYSRRDRYNETSSAGNESIGTKLLWGTFATDCVDNTQS
ncbi:hypothetical protein MPTK1_3g01180 [Marchantia polymorpha subsp. ruderalis]|uniref:Uncharacterized protein n=2 Tax=Marchantia polymorpha TaxID=3197 RepID=A0AAF6AW84_MARPO|nr:hypothetical protein MARPO_0007s0112 [Marchantia polymorpha]BBN04018.1 hypothetical protein Mp_3g01180 [Marchantia polymorpha subsp. ruderalis]|eukprot:PTQ47705.1 hypothetical protein MARPO_0007s0112 [Marchantia polymorpha]